MTFGVDLRTVLLMYIEHETLRQQSAPFLEVLQ